ncbi:MAG TPA: hypothetical protein VN579_07285 [Bryobacteraceae bacterium]|nr:hypothetical protein [Bryobacteraceae bacterium]
MSATSATGKLQVVESAETNCSDFSGKAVAGDYSREYVAQIVQYFLSVRGSKRQTARKFRLTAREVGEILHVWEIRQILTQTNSRPPASAAGVRVFRAGMAA